MKSKIKYRFQQRNRSKFALTPYILKRKLGVRTRDCFMCGKGICADHARLQGHPDRIRTLSHYEQCDTCKISFVSGNGGSHDQSLRARTKVKASLRKRGMIKQSKRKTRRCKLTREMWIKRCNRIDDGWYFGSIQSHFNR